MAWNKTGRKNRLRYGDIFITPNAAPPPKVAIDNESSGFFAIIEVHASDEPNLLFKLADTLYRKLELDIPLQIFSIGLTLRRSCAYRVCRKSA